MRLTRVVVAVGVVLAALAPCLSAVEAQSDGVSFGFSGSASADGVQMTVNVPGAPVSDTPVNGGGPSAQAAMDSLGTSTGYAALPDPGETVLSVPGLVVGLLASGAGGLPPIKLPSPPDYPLYVSSDAAFKPEAAAGSGPYQLSAVSDSTSSTAQASAGFQSGPTGNAALVSTTATVTASDDKVEVKAVADFQGLTIGPLTLGQVKSTATQSMDYTGTVTPSASMEITALRIAGLPIQITPQGLNAGGVVVPLPINDVLADLLKAAGITMEVLAGQTFPDRVVAPALRLTFPFTTPNIPNVGQFNGTATVVIGGATAQLSGAVFDTSAPSADTDMIPSDGELGGAPIPSTSGTDFGTLPLGNTSAVGAPTPPVAAARPTPAPQGATAAAGIPIAENLDVGSVYLVILAGGLAALGLGQLMRRMGEKVWISMDG